MQPQISIKRSEFVRRIVAIMAIISFIMGSVRAVPAQTFSDLYYCWCPLGTEYHNEFYVYYHYYNHPFWGWGWQPEYGTIRREVNITIYYLAWGNIANIPVVCYDGQVVVWSAQASVRSTFYGEHSYPTVIYDGYSVPYTSGWGSPIGTYPRFFGCNPNGW